MEILFSNGFYYIKTPTFTDTYMESVTRLLAANVIHSYGRRLPSLIANPSISNKSQGVYVGDEHLIDLIATIQTELTKIVPNTTIKSCKVYVDPKYRRTDPLDQFTNVAFITVDDNILFADGSYGKMVSLCHHVNDQVPLYSIFMAYMIIDNYICEVGPLIICNTDDLIVQIFESLPITTYVNRSKSLLQNIRNIIKSSKANSFPVEVDFKHSLAEFETIRKLMLANNVPNGSNPFISCMLRLEIDGSSKIINNDTESIRKMIMIDWDSNTPTFQFSPEDLTKIDFELESYLDQMLINGEITFPKLMKQYPLFHLDAAIPGLISKLPLTVAVHQASESNHTMLIRCRSENDNICAYIIFKIEEGVIVASETIVAITNSNSIISSEDKLRKLFPLGLFQGEYIVKLWRILLTILSFAVGMSNRLRTEIVDGSQKIMLIND